MLHFEIEYIYDGSPLVHKMDIYTKDADSAKARFEEILSLSAPHKIQKITVLEEV